MRGRSYIGGWLGALLKYVRLSAYLPTWPLFIQFWKTMLPSIESAATKFAKYFKTECLRGVKAAMSLFTSPCGGVG